MARGVTLRQRPQDSPELEGPRSGLFSVDPETGKTEMLRSWFTPAITAGPLWEYLWSHRVVPRLSLDWRTVEGQTITFPWGDPAAVTPLWALARDPSIPIHERITIALTFDRTWVPPWDLEVVAANVGRFVEGMAPGGVGMGRGGTPLSLCLLRLSEAAIGMRGIHADDALGRRAQTRGAALGVVSAGENGDWPGDLGWFSGAVGIMEAIGGGSSGLARRLRGVEFD